MGFLFFLRLAVKCFDILAWPLLSLGYPLCASIRAIESDSNEDILNLVTYWVSSSLISLFEHTFAGLLLRLSFWPYMKIMAVCFLVMPDFYGSFYAYKHIIHPCVLTIVHFVADQFGVWKDFIFQKEDFLAAAERYVSENGPQALEKLISDKSNCRDINVDAKDIKEVAATQKLVDLPKPECHAALKDIRTEEVTELKEAAVAECTQINGMPAHLVQFKKNLHASAETEDGATPPGSNNIIPGIPALKQVQVQKEWACAMCQVTTTSEFTMKEHYKGRKHKNKQEELKAKKLNQPKAGPKISVPSKGSNGNAEIHEEKVKLNGTSASSQKIHPNAEPKNVVPDDAANQKLKTRRRQKEEKLKVNGAKVQSPKNLKRNSIDVKQSPLWCSICSITCPGEIDMASHLRGKKHLARISELTGSVLV